MRYPGLPVLAALLVACSKSAPPAPVSLAQVCEDQYAPIEEKGLSVQKRVQVTGHLWPAGGTVLCSDTCPLSLTEEPGGKGLKITVFVKIGTGGSTMDKLPDRYRAEDFKVRAEDGRLLPMGAKVRVTARRGGSTKASAHATCFLNSDVIESG